MLHFIGEPVDLFLFADIFELNADMPRVALLQVCKNIRQRRCAQADQVARIKGFLHVVIRKTEEGEIQVGPPVLPGTDRVRFGDQVAFIAVAENKPVSPQFLFPVGARKRSGCRDRNRGSYGSTGGRAGTVAGAIGGAVRDGRSALANGKIKSFEKTSEFRVYRFRIPHEILVETLNIGWM